MLCGYFEKAEYFTFLQICMEQVMNWFRKYDANTFLDKELPERVKK